MLIFRSHEYKETKITALLSDNNSGLFIWIAFEKNVANICPMKKVSAHDVEQIFYEFDVPTNKINRMVGDNNSIYLAVDDPINICYVYSKVNPFSGPFLIPIPIGVNEQPIDIAIDGTDLYFLTPGIISGEVATIVHMTTSGTLIEVFELDRTGDTINNASGLTVDDVGDLWVVTNESPVRLVRVFQATGGLNFQVNEIV